MFLLTDYRFSYRFHSPFWCSLQAKVFVISSFDSSPIVALSDFVLTDLYIFSFLLQTIIYKIFANKRYFIYILHILSYISVEC